MVVGAFFDGLQAEKPSSKECREAKIPLPTAEQGYARVMLVGSTGAGKTTLLRHLIGSDHRRDRFPSTSTARTTTADIEIITGGAYNGSFQAAITFLSEHEVRSSIEECLETASLHVVRNSEDSEIAAALLEHPEQRFRLSYPLGGWQQESPGSQTEPSQGDLEYEYEDESAEPASILEESEIVSGEDLARNNRCLANFVTRAKEVATAVGKEIETVRGELQRLDNANERQDWLDAFTEALYNHDSFKQLSLDIVETVKSKFDLISEGAFEFSTTGWPILWYYDSSDRETFLRQVRWFASNHHQQFGRLLTPLVDGIRARGYFQPDHPALRDRNRKLVLLDGEGLGHSAKEATSISTRVTECFAEATMILLVDSAQSPMQAASLELLRTVGHSGHAYKIAVAFTHFDQVKGDNLRSYQQKRDHVAAAIGNAIVSLRQSAGAPVTSVLEQRLSEHSYYFGSLEQQTDRIPRGFVRDIGGLLMQMQCSAAPIEQVEAAPLYNIARLELMLRDATDGFKEPWLARLGLRYSEGLSKEHWTRIKALCRRIANLWDNQYKELRPVSDFVRELQKGVSRWLDQPAGWIGEPHRDHRQATIDSIRREVFGAIHQLAERRLITKQTDGWQEAFFYRGTGSARHRAVRMERIYAEAAPSVSSVMDQLDHRFAEEVTKIVHDAIRKAGGALVAD